MEDVRLQEAHTVLLARVEVIESHQPRAPSRFDEVGGCRMGDLVAHSQESVAAVKWSRAALVPFRSFEIRQHIVPSPSWIAELSPLVVVALVAAYVDHP